jgi:predicted transcriptional regulator of viral defense system
MPGRIWETAFEQAIEQYGFITAANLRAFNADPVRLRQWHKHGKITCVTQGIYRFPLIPPTPLDPYMLATLWPSGRGTLSHATALELHALCDVNPTSIHITVPPDYRPRRRDGEHYTVHHEALNDEDLAWHEGIRIVTPAVAIRQSINDKVQTHLIRQAIETARRLGVAPISTLDNFEEQLETR